MHGTNCSGMGMKSGCSFRGMYQVFVIDAYILYEKMRLKMLDYKGMKMVTDSFILLKV